MAGLGQVTIWFAKKAADCAFGARVVGHHNRVRALTLAVAERTSQSKAHSLPAALTGFCHVTDLFASGVDEIRLAFDNLDPSSRASPRCLQCGATDWCLSRRCRYPIGRCGVRFEIARRYPSGTLRNGID